MVSRLQLVAGVAGVVLGVVLARILWRAVRSIVPSQDPAEEWHAETIRLCSQTLALIDRFEADPPEVDHDELRDGMADMVTQLSRHAGTAVEMEVDEDVIGAVRNASIACKELSEAEIKIGDASEWEDALAQASESVEHAREEAEAYLENP